jgi:hypothetical protein
LIALIVFTSGESPPAVDAQLAVVHQGSDWQQIEHSNIHTYLETGEINLEWIGQFQLSTNVNLQRVNNNTTKTAEIPH